MGFGRILRDSAGRFLRIVEERDCTPEEKAIREVNPSCYVFDLPLLWDALDQIGTSNAQHEYYLTDAPERLAAMGKKVMALNVLRADDILGVNTRQHLAQAVAVMQARIQDHWMTQGVTIVDPHNTHIDGRATIGPDTVIHPFTVISGEVKIGARCQVGPFAHLRPGTVLEEGVEVGAFVEIKESHLETGTIARHLAYLGNASVGRDANIGAGAITANFDGSSKHETEIGDRVRIGAGAVMVAPVKVGHDAVVGAGAVITRGKHVDPHDTVVGVPARSLAAETDDL
jgi:bifunctional UDP-N-acetylglucosamine pyrophosphorylase/glucosamine-1-phosphate N-acetyltransferase